MSYVKHLLFFLCALFALSGCSTLKNQDLRRGAYRSGWQVDNHNYDPSKFIYYIATAKYDEPICLEVGDGIPVCITIEQREPTILDTTEEPYLFVVIQEPSEFGEQTIKNAFALREEIIE